MVDIQGVYELLDGHREERERKRREREERERAIEAELVEEPALTEGESHELEE